MMTTTRERLRRLERLEQRHPEPLEIIVVYEDPDGNREEAYHVTISGETMRENGGPCAELP
jgi:hypothetical protein